MYRDEPVESRDIAIPAGSMVIVHVYGAHHAARHWPDPEIFDTDRFLKDNVKQRAPFTYLPFGGGPRMCIGNNLAALEALNLHPDDFSRKGIHPAFGAVTAGELLSTWAVHDLTHLHQLSRVMAHQYREVVGPWSAYLGVLRCNGHSAP